MMDDVLMQNVQRNGFIAHSYNDTNLNSTTSQKQQQQLRKHCHFVCDMDRYTGIWTTFWISVVQLLGAELKQLIMAALCNREGHYIYRQHCAKRKPAGI